MSSKQIPPVTWEQGRDVVARLIETGKLQKVVASRDHADRLIQQSKNHLKSSTISAADDPEGAYSLLYTAARKSLTAVLEVQGLRPTASGGHVVIYEALRAQVDPPLGRVVLTFNRLRRSRHHSEYPPVSEPELTEEDVREDLVKAIEIVEVATRLLEEFPVF